MSVTVPGGEDGRPGSGCASGGDLAFLEAELHDADGATIATATAIARVIPLDQARAAA